MKWVVWVGIIMISSFLISASLEAQITGAARGHGRVKGTVTDAEGKPIEGVVVRFTSERLNTSFELRTDKKGEWVAGGIAGGQWHLDFIKEGYGQKNITASFSIVVFNKPIYTTLEKLGPGVAQSKVKGLELVQEGNRLKDQKDFSNAILKYEAAIRENPDWFELYSDIGSLHAQMKQPEKASEAFRKLLDKNPAHVGGRVALANLLLERKNIAEAKKILAPMNLDSLKNPNLAFNLGANFYNAKETKEAIVYFERAIALDPKMVDAHFQLGVAFLSEQEAEKAKREFQKVIELSPLSEDAKLAQQMMATIQ